MNRLVRSQRKSNRTFVWSTWLVIRLVVAFIVNHEEVSVRVQVFDRCIWHLKPLLIKHTNQHYSTNFPLDTPFIFESDLKRYRHASPTQSMHHRNMVAFKSVVCAARKHPGKMRQCIFMMFALCTKGWGEKECHSSITSFFLPYLPFFATCSTHTTASTGNSIISHETRLVPQQCAENSQHIYCVLCFGWNYSLREMSMHTRSRNLISCDIGESA